MLSEIYDGLTRPLSPADRKGGFLKREPHPRFLPADTPENLREYFYEHGYTDGLPIVLPTEERVQEMLAATSHDPDEWVGQMRPSPPHEAWYYTVELVAVNAVMAGAKPEYFPTILAIASKGDTSLISSTTSFARMVVVNGPVVEEIGMNSGIGALGPFSRANSTIGRSWTLISKNLGSSGEIGETYLGTQGNQLNYNNVCFAETEASLPAGWKPLHVQKGFHKSDSVISVFSGWSLSNLAGYSRLPKQEVIREWLEHYFAAGTNQVTLILDPLVAADLASSNFPTKEAFARYLADNTGTPGWLYWSRYSDALKKAKEGVEPYAGWLKRGKEAVVPVSRYRLPGRNNADIMASRNDNDPATSIEIIVTGGETNTYWSGGDFAYVGSASVDHWR